MSVPEPLPLRSPAGCLHLHSVAKAPPHLLQLLHGAPTTSLAAHLRLLGSFPGPLVPSSSKEKVGLLPNSAHAASRPLPCLQLPAVIGFGPPLSFHSELGLLQPHLLGNCPPQVAQFCAEQAEAEAGGPPGFVPVHAYGASPDAAAAERGTLWSVLRVLALQQGKLRAAPGNTAGATSASAAGNVADAGDTPEAQLAAALLEGAESSSGAMLLQGAAPGPTAEDAAARAQELLLEGRRAEALK